MAAAECCWHSKHSIQPTYAQSLQGYRPAFYGLSRDADAQRKWTLAKRIEALSRLAGMGLAWASEPDPTGCASLLLVTLISKLLSLPHQNILDYMLARLVIFLFRAVVGLEESFLRRKGSSSHGRFAAAVSRMLLLAADGGHQG